MGGLSTKAAAHFIWGLWRRLPLRLRGVHCPGWFPIGMAIIELSSGRKKGPGPLQLYFMLPTLFRSALPISARIRFLDVPE
jgi:hypothetical protein